ncbi:MAG TPA: alpha/beta fold hydrolase [Phycicoccus sp.]|nr:alpha/beta fold hydrolase [Phycicoccus sp.]
MPLTRPELRGTLPDNARGVVLVLHGGGVRGKVPMHWRAIPVLRKLPFARAIDHAGHHQIAVVRLRNRYFGWNGDEQSPVQDARWALDVIRQRLPGVPIALVGHSMGGRVALTLAGEPDVRAVVALAPWIEPEDVPHGRPGLAVLLMHGTKDRTTDPRLTQRFAAQLRKLGAGVTLIDVRDGHAMLWQARRWHSTAARFVRDALVRFPL